jgi:hypothetical protein
MPSDPCYCTPHWRRLRARDAPREDNLLRGERNAWSDPGRKGRESGDGGLKSSWLGARETASGVSSQNFENTNKKPNAQKM